MNQNKNIFLSGERPPAREYKDRLFRMVFKEKDQFLELYNALNGTAYDNPGDLTVTTLENAIYMGMRNDVSYLLYDRLALYEHQASINPNMPLRNLFYVSDIYSGLTKDSNLYGSKLVRLPEPQFVVFYNGADELPERSILRLSDEAGVGGTGVKHQSRVQPGADGTLPDPPGIYGLCGHGTEICKGNGLSGGSGPSNPGVSRKRNFGGFSLQELGGGEKSEHL